MLQQGEKVQQAKLVGLMQGNKRVWGKFNKKAHWTQFGTQ
jgi:hypothetical protein